MDWRTRHGVPCQHVTDHSDSSHGEESTLGLFTRQKSWRQGLKLPSHGRRAGSRSKNGRAQQDELATQDSGRDVWRDSIAGWSTTVELAVTHDLWQNLAQAEVLRFVNNHKAVSVVLTVPKLC